MIRDTGDGRHAKSRVGMREDEHRHIGRKAVVRFLKARIDLSPDLETAWNKVRRWRRRYGLPVIADPNGRPSITEEDYAAWRRQYRERAREGMRLREELRMQEEAALNKQHRNPGPPGR